MADYRRQRHFTHHTHLDPRHTEQHHLGTYYNGQNKSQNPHQTVKYLTATTAGVSSFILSGVVMTAATIGMILATPPLVIFSPVLIPAGITILLIIGGFLTSGGLGVAGLSTLTWLYNYVTGTHLVGADTMEYAKGKIESGAREIGEKVSDFTGVGEQYGGGGAGRPRREFPELRREEGMTMRGGGRYTTGREERTTTGGDGGGMYDYDRHLYQYSSGPTQAVKFLTATTVGLGSLALSGLTMVATIIGLTVSTPPLILFSPVIIPAVITVAIICSGFVLSAGLGGASLSTLAWMYNYVTGRHPTGSGTVDYVSSVVESGASTITEKAKDIGHQVKETVKDVGHDVHETVREEGGGGGRRRRQGKDVTGGEGMEEQQQTWGGGREERMRGGGDYDYDYYYDRRRPEHQMSTTSTVQNIFPSGQTVRETVKVVTATTMGLSFLVLSGLTMSATVIGLVLSTPPLLIFSPVLVPAGLTLLAILGGFFCSGGLGVAGLSTATWLYNYVTGRHPTGAGTVDYVGSVVGQGARQVGEKALEFGHHMQEAGKELGHQVTEAGREIGHTVQEAGKELGHKVQKAGTKLFEGGEEGKGGRVQGGEDVTGVAVDVDVQEKPEEVVVVVKGRETREAGRRTGGGVAGRTEGGAGGNPATRDVEVANK